MLGGHISLASKFLSRKALCRNLLDLPQLRRTASWEEPVLFGCHRSILAWIRVFKAGQTDTDESRKIRCAVGDFRSGVDERAPFQFHERKAAADQRTAFEHQFVSFAVEKNAPVPPRHRRAAARWVRMLVVQLVVAALYQRG